MGEVVATIATPLFVVSVGDVDEAESIVDEMALIEVSVVDVFVLSVDCCGDPVYNVISSGNGTTCRRCVRSKSSSECVFLLPLVLPNSFVRNSFKKYAAMLFLNLIDHPWTRLSITYFKVFENHFLCPLFAESQKHMFTGT